METTSQYEALRNHGKDGGLRTYTFDDGQCAVVWMDDADAQAERIEKLIALYEGGEWLSDRPRVRRFLEMADGVDVEATRKALLPCVVVKLSGMGVEELDREIRCLDNDLAMLCEGIVG